MSDAEIAALLAAAPVEPCGGAALHLLAPADWLRLAGLVDPADFAGLFVADGCAHALFFRAAPLLVAVALDNGAYPALSPAIPEAGWYERRAAETHGATATGASDTRPAIRHGEGDAAWPRFDTPADEGAFQVGQGPVAGLIARPVHRRFTIAAGRIARLEYRHGYAYRDIAALLHGKSPRAAARFAARLAGDAAVAHALAFARAAEAAGGCDIPPRAAALRAAMLDIERVTAHLLALAAALEAAGRPGLATRLGRVRDDIAAAVAVLFGHRLMMDAVTPGGLEVDARSEALPALAATLAAAAPLVRLVGGFRVRRALGPAAALARDRARAVLARVSAIVPAIEAAPPGEIVAALPPVSAAGLGSAASSRGMVHHWVKLHDGQIAAAALIDPAPRLAGRLEEEAVGLDIEGFAVLEACYAVPTGAIDG
ncbi:MAG TPA: Ni Fe-hydrogenase III large subunit [Acidiphilium sp.]|nr:Ni Fe-hydrogenase III large subunit [Acidiphilium sp.]